MHTRARATTVARAAVTLAFALMLIVICAGRAEAEPAIKAAGCQVYDTNQVDPIAFATHMHHQFGNTSTTNESTGASLKNHLNTSCNAKADWFTTAGWFPVEQNEPVSKVAVYYRAPGDQTKVKTIPTGLQILATQQEYNCIPDRGGNFQDSPVYGCTGDFNTRVSFPDCWNQDSLQETTLVYSRNGVCPASHSYRIPRISYLIQHNNADNRVTNPLLVSAGLDDWHPWADMHADYFAANQDVFNDKLIRECLIEVGDNEARDAGLCGGL